MEILTGPYNVHIVAAGDAARLRPWSVPQRRLTNYVLTCSLKGEEELSVEGERFLVPRGGCYLLPPCVMSDIDCRKGNLPIWAHFEVIWNNLRGRHPWPICNDPHWESTRKFAQPSPRDIWGVDLPIVLPKLFWARVAEVLPAIVKGWRTGQPARVLRAQYVLEGLLLDWVSFEWERGAQPNMLSHQERIERAESLVRNDLAAGLGVADMAKAAGFSRSRFSDVYFDLRKQTPGHFLLQSRMLRAQTLLQQTNLSANAIAQMVGYRDGTAFGRAFRGEFNVTPLAWRNQKKSGAQ